MLVRFRVENFRSFRDPQELSMVASSGHRDHEVAVQPVRGFGSEILPAAAVYGANASGKSTLLFALAFMQSAVENSHSRWSPSMPVPVEPFLLDGSSSQRTSTFTIEVWLNDTLFQYGFEVNATSVLREWLYAHPPPARRRQVWFVRDAGSPESIKFGKRFSGGNRAIWNLTRANSLFLSAAAQNNHLLLQPLYTWFVQGLTFLWRTRDDLVNRIAQECRDESTKLRVEQLLATADLGIIGLEFSEIKPNAEEKGKFDGLAEKMHAILKEYGIELPQSDPSFILTSFRHRGGDDQAPIALPLHQESAGTQAWLGLVGAAIGALDSGGTLCVDELDSSLHPLLGLAFLRFFNDPKLNPKGAQLVFNTHDANLLTANVLRRDQIWFVEKDRTGASHLYPLSDFRPRRDENLGRGYLQGRYGAIPFLGSLSDEVA